MIIELPSSNQNSKSPVSVDHANGRFGVGKEKLNNRSERLQKETRGDIRVKENKRILWKVDGNGHQGQGRVCNISTSGMLIETDKAFELTDQCVLNFDTDLGTENFIPPSGRLVWYQKKDHPHRYFCGISFIDPSTHVSDKLKQRILKKKSVVVRFQRIRFVVNGILITALVGLTGYVLWLSQDTYFDLTRSHQGMLVITDHQATMVRGYAEELSHVEMQLKATRDMYVETQAILTQTRQELEATKALLSETEHMLAQANTTSSQLKTELLSLQEQHEQQMTEITQRLGETIASLEDKNQTLTEELQSVQAKLDYYSGGIHTMEEGRTLVAFYHTKMRLVKSKIKQFRREAEQARITALKERDHIQLVLGNNGFFVKDGQPVRVDMDRYNAAVIEDVDTLESQQSSQDVKIDVRFVD